MKSDIIDKKVTICTECHA